MVLVHFPQEALGAHHRPQTEEFSVSEEHFISRWAPKLHGAFSKNHICYHGMAQGTKPRTARLLDGLVNELQGAPGQTDSIGSGFAKQLQEIDNWVAQSYTICFSL